MINDLGNPCWVEQKDPLGDWQRLALNAHRDKRLFPARGGGRRMRHPFLPSIVYPQLPDITEGFGYDVMRHPVTVSTKTEGATAVSKFIGTKDDVQLKEVWSAGELSVLTRLLHQFHRFLINPLPDGYYLGWFAPDLSPKHFSVELLDVECNDNGGYIVEKIGNADPMMRRVLTVTFKVVKEPVAPAGSMTMVGH